LEISEFQELMAELYLARDRRRGVYATLLWVVEEVGELAEAVRKGDVDSIGSEIADVIAWVCSLANILGIDVERELKRKWGARVCPRCGSNPCTCPNE